MRIRNRLHKLLLVLFLIGLPLSAMAGKPYDENRLKAAITYNIAKFVKWPEGTFVDVKSPLVICVLSNGDTPLGFDALEGQIWGLRPVHVRYLKSINNYRGGHILYVANSEAHQLDNVLTAVHNTPLLTISDIEGFARRGGMINLVKVGKNIRFAINLDASMAAHLKVSSKLHALATEVISSGY